MFVSRYPSYRAVYITCMSGAGNNIIHEYHLPCHDVILVIHFLHPQLGLSLAQTLRLHSSFPFMRATHLLGSKHRQARVVYIGVLCSVRKSPSLNSRYTILRDNPKREQKMKKHLSTSNLSRPSKDESPGTSFENPLVDFHAQQDLTIARYYALDPTNGIIKTTVAGIAEYHAKGFAMLNSCGLRLDVFSRSGRNAVGFVVKQAQGGKKVLSRLNDREWEFIYVKTALLEAATDDTIHYGKFAESYECPTRLLIMCKRRSD